MTQAEDLTRGSLRTALIRLSLPLGGSMLLETIFNLVNGYWVGRLGTSALAAVNLSSFTVWLLFGIAGTVATGTNARVAQELGALRREDADANARTGLWAALALGLVMLVPVEYGAHAWLRWQLRGGEDVGEPLRLATGYLRLVFCFAPFFCLNEACSAILRAHGDTRTPLKLYTVGFGLNFVLDPALILWAHLGIFGAALASGISFGLMSVVYVVLVHRRNLLGSQRFSLERLHGILRIGVPPSLSSVFFSLVYILVTPVVGHFGPAALAALGIGHRVESFGYLFGYGLSLATVTLVGQNIGAGRPERAREAGREALKLVTLGMCGVTLATIVLAPSLTRLFSSDPEVLRMGTDYLRVIALSEIAMGINLVVQGVLSGAGRPALPAAASVVSAGLRVPFTRYFAITRTGGAFAIWTVISSLVVVQSFFSLAIFRFRALPGEGGDREL